MRKTKTPSGLFATVWGCIGEALMSNCQVAEGQQIFCRLPFGFLCLCTLAQSSLFPKDSDAHTLCQIVLDLWNVSVGNEQKKKSPLKNKVI